MKRTVTPYNVLWDAGAVSDFMNQGFFYFFYEPVKLVRKLLQRFPHKLEWPDSSCSRVDNSLIQMIDLEWCLWWTEIPKRELWDLGVRAQLMLQDNLLLSNFGLIVTEIHIWVKTDSCLGTKSVVKGIYLALWNAYANQCQCLYDFGQKRNINITQVEWE